jgi:hypothetical protein
MAGCSEGKRQDIRNYLEIYLSLKYCEVTCLSYSLKCSSVTYPAIGRCHYISRGRCGVSYGRYGCQCGGCVISWGRFARIPKFRDMWHYSKIPLDIHFEHSTLFVTIFCIEMFTNSGHKLLRTKIHCRTPGHMSGVRNDLRRKLHQPMDYNCHKK